MPDFDVIIKGSEGVRMRSDELFVEDSAFVFARNMQFSDCLLYTSPSPRDGLLSRMPSSA